jgi:hypothetical protein
MRLSRRLSPPGVGASKTRARSGFDAVRSLGIALPDVDEDTYYGEPALMVRGQMFACLASHRSAEPDTLVVRLEFAQRDELLDAKPETYYLTDHYVGYPCVLVRLGRIPRDDLRDLLLMAWRFMSAAKAPRSRKRPRKPSRARR